MLSLPCLTMCIKNVLTWWGADLHWINKGLSTGWSKIHQMTSSSSSFYYAADLTKPERVNLTLLCRSFGVHSTPLAIIWSSLSLLLSLSRYYYHYHYHVITITITITINITFTITIPPSLLAHSFTHSTVD